MKKLLYISGSLLPSKFANSVHVMKMCQAFAKNNINTTLTAMGTDGGNDFKYYDVEESFIIKKSHPTTSAIWRFFSYNLLCFEMIKNHRDLVYLRYFYPLIWCLFYKRSTVVEFHGVPQSIIIKILLKRLFRSKHFVAAVFITEKLKEIYENQFDIPSGKCKVLADCADDPGDIIENSDTKEIGYVGHLYEGRGIEVIIEIAKALPESNFHLVGGHQKDVERYRDIAPKNIKFYGFLTQRELKNVYSKFSIALAPYQHEVGIGKAGANSAKWMSPMKIFEYMSYKKAIILSDLSVLREIGKDEIHFLYVSPDDPQKWIEAIRLLQSKEDLFFNLKREAYKNFQDNFTWKERARKINQFSNLIH